MPCSLSENSFLPCFGKHEKFFESARLRSGRRHGASIASDGTKEGTGDNVVWVAALPNASVFAVGVVAQLFNSPSNYWAPFVFKTVPAVLVMYLALACQAGAVYFVAEIVEEGDGPCDSSLEHLQLIALLCYTALAYKDLFESVRLWTWLCLVPPVTTFTDVHFVHRDVDTGAPVGCKGSVRVCVLPCFPTPATHSALLPARG